MKKRVSRRKLLTGAAALAAYAALPAAPKAAVPGIGPTLLTGGGKLSLMQILTKVGVASNVKCCLDAGSADSYPGSGGTWFDLSGNDNDWITDNTFAKWGATGNWSKETHSTVTGRSLGTFNGTAGGLSPDEYFSNPPRGQMQYFNSGSIWDHATTSDTLAHSGPANDLDFLRSAHTADADCTIILGFRRPASLGAAFNLFQTGAIVAQYTGLFIEPGFAIYLSPDSFSSPGGLKNWLVNTTTTAGRLQLTRVSSPSGGNNAGVIDTGLTVPADQFVLVQIALTASNQRARVNNNSNATTSSTWTGGSTSNQSDAGFTVFPNYAFGVNFGGGVASDPDGWRWTCMALLDTALSSAELTSIYNLFKKYRDHTLP